MTKASQNNTFFVFIKKHKCLVAFFILTWKLWMILLLHTVIMPVRCHIWEGKEVEVFLTPEEWRKLSGTYELLKDTKWIYYPTIDGEPETEPFFIENQGKYQPEIQLNGTTYSLMSVNNKYPNLNVYVYINPSNFYGHDKIILYDHKLKKTLINYNMIIGYIKSPLSGLYESIKCNYNDFSDGSTLIENYLNN